MLERSRDKSAAELLHSDVYTPEELSELTGVGLDVIRRAAFDGEMTATIVDSDIVSIPRSEAISWLDERSRTASEETPY